MSQSSDPKLGYWAQHFTYRDALAAGETSVGNTQGVEAMSPEEAEQLVRDVEADAVEAMNSIWIKSLSIPAGR